MSPENLMRLGEANVQWRIWRDRIGYAVMIGFFMIAMLLCVSIIYNAYFNSPPVHVISLDKPPAQPLCPGDHFDVSQKVEITQPVFLYSYISVMNDGLDYNIYGTQDSFTPRPQPKETTYTETFPWQVPNLSPGRYQRVVTIRGYRSNERPVYSFVRFEVKGGCDEWNGKSDRGFEDSFDCWTGMGCDHGLLAIDTGAAGSDIDLRNLYHQLWRYFVAEPDGDIFIESTSR